MRLSVLIVDDEPHARRHIKSLLAFKRWANTPIDQRHSLVNNDQHVSIIAQASVLESQRFLLLQDISNGKVDFKVAANESSKMKYNLHLSGR